MFAVTWLLLVVGVSVWCLETAVTRHFVCYVIYTTTGVKDLVYFGCMCLTGVEFVKW
jgi:hypothetical protein